ncbi:IS110 family transposase [Dehalobacterium formicoaceticum]|uniref:IS110 family transposase n=1 Tax=Dehalobacterium formicoaceticum TaxID=51515 RepID=A0ABT1Y2B6_9FIRM|nr:IS110 family transposase [Dehalobacterium formicoaceticum]MCR6545017.1 IS110 family transposase [Dehalobacterium formicoaceticum]
MSKCNYLSVGIDVGSAFSWMSIVDPDENLILKPFKIIHNNLDSLERALAAIKKAEESNSMKSQTFLESTGIYHFPLFCYLMESGFEAFVINPLITYSIKNIGIRKVKNDKLDSIGIAKLGLKPNLQVSVIPAKLVLELRALTRNYYNLVDIRSSYVNQLKTHLHTVFPQYLDVFCDVTGTTSMMILESYPTPDKILRAHKDSLISKISKASRKGINKATEKYDKLVLAAKSAKVFGCNLDSVYFNISTTLTLIKGMDSAIAATMDNIHTLVKQFHSEKFVQQVNWLNSITGIGFLSAVTIMCEIGDYSVFKTPKQLFAYFGMDPEVKQSGKFNATEVHMSKRGSRIARRAIFAVALACIRKKRNGEAINPYLYDFYQKKASVKPKMVALGAVMHKVCNYIFAVLRDETEFTVRSPEEHRDAYKPSVTLAA